MVRFDRIDEVLNYWCQIRLILLQPQDAFGKSYLWSKLPPFGEAVLQNLFWSTSTSLKIFFNDLWSIMVGKCLSLHSWLLHIYQLMSFPLFYKTNTADMSSIFSLTGSLDNHLNDVIKTSHIEHAMRLSISNLNSIIPPLQVVLLKLLLNRIAFKVYKLRQNWLIWVLNIL